MAEPELPGSASASALDPDVRRDLRGLQKETAEKVAQHLVAAGQLVDTEPERALEHARYARRRAARIAVVREAAGIVAYHAGEWNEALGEFRAARRMGGGQGHVPVMADIERALGRPERALELTRGPEARGLDQADRIELMIVGAGARRDLGEIDAAVVALQVPELDAGRRDPWSARLFYAYADNLLAADRTSEAVQWFVHAYDADTEQATDAAARIEDLTGDLPPGAVVEDSDDVAFGIEDMPDDLSGTVDVAEVRIDDATDLATDGSAGSPGGSGNQASSDTADVPRAAYVAETDDRPDAAEVLKDAEITVAVEPAEPVAAIGESEATRTPEAPEEPETAGESAATETPEAIEEPETAETVGTTTEAPVDPDDRGATAAGDVGAGEDRGSSAGDRGE